MDNSTKLKEMLHLLQLQQKEFDIEINFDFFNENLSHFPDLKLISISHDYDADWGLSTWFIILKGEITDVQDFVSDLNADDPDAYCYLDNIHNHYFTVTFQL